MPKKWAKEVEVEEGELIKHGWRKNNKASTRHRALIKSVQEDGYVTTQRRLNFLTNVTKDDETRIKAERDSRWLRRHYTHYEVRGDNAITGEEDVVITSRKTRSSAQKVAEKKELTQKWKYVTVWSVTERHSGRKTSRRVSR